MGGEMEPTVGFDMENRDPNQLNDHLQVLWDDIIGEPEGIRSVDCVWRCSYKCFRGTKNCCYMVLSVLFGPCLAFCIGCNFACLAFQHIWCLGPSLRTWKISCAAVRSFTEVALQAMCGPCAEVLGMVFSKIKVRYQKLPDAEKETDIMNV